MSVDNVLVTPGGQAGLFAAHHAALDEGHAGLLIDPYYATYPGTIRAVGGRPVPVAARPENGFQPDPADIARAARTAGRQIAPDQFAEQPHGRGLRTRHARRDRRGGNGP
jgi:aspartate/methionine/tyrosine aminotransferase